MSGEWINSKKNNIKRVRLIQGYWSNCIFIIIFFVVDFGVVLQITNELSSTKKCRKEKTFKTKTLSLKTSKEQVKPCITKLRELVLIWLAYSMRPKACLYRYENLERAPVGICRDLCWRLCIHKSWNEIVYYHHHSTLSYQH